MASSGEYYCGYCLTNAEQMLDACKLPCGHIFCRLCLLNDYQNSPKLKCISCRQEFGDLDLMMLKSCSTETKPPHCEICENISEIFCISCKKSMCKEHAKMHDSYHKNFGADHMTISSHASKSKPADEKRMCNTHNDEVKGGCIACQSLLCFHCVAESKCPQSLGLMHEIIDVHKLSGSYKGCLNEKMSKLWSRKNDIEALDKKANYLLAQEQTKCESMKQMVDKVLEEQCAMLAEKARIIKVLVDSHYNCCESQVSVYTKSLGSNKDDIEQLCKEIHDVKQQTDYEIFLKYKKMVEKSDIFLAAALNIFALDILQEIYKFEQKEAIEKEMEVPNLLKLQLKEADDSLRANRIDIEQLEKENSELKARHEEVASQLKETEDELKRRKENSQQLENEKTVFSSSYGETVSQLKETRADLKRQSELLQEFENNKNELMKQNEEATKQLLIAEEKSRLSDSNLTQFRHEVTQLIQILARDERQTMQRLLLDSTIAQDIKTMISQNLPVQQGCKTQ